MREIHLPSEELAEELQKYLQETKFSSGTYDKESMTIQFPDNMNALVWSGLKGTVEKWAKGRKLGIVESLRLEPLETENAPAIAVAGPKSVNEDVKKRLEGLTPEMAKERLSVLQSKPFSELTDAEYEERLALTQDLDKALKRKPSK